MDLDDVIAAVNAVMIGSTSADAVGYAFIVASTVAREPSTYWSFWRDECVIEEVAHDAAAWLEAFLGYAMTRAKEKTG